MNTQNMTELIPYVNSELKKGLSIVKVEKNLGFGKDTLRRKIIRQGYTYDKKIHRFIIDNNNSQNITKDKPNNSNPSNNLTHHITHEDLNSKSERVLTNEDFQILFKMIDLYKYKTSNSNDKEILIDRKNEDITTRSFRSYKKVFDLFSAYCTDNKLNQKDAIADALISFISK
ncbi:hypothetical protein [Clostridium botulinum]|uniref:hypothetical protein n=1 Tax=Clostridium botulinum TaxID=1491 RepID=UPI0012B6896E|nr:hypothetical protein [Clostridium botulinum]